MPTVSRSAPAHLPASRFPGRRWLAGVLAIAMLASLAVGWWEWRQASRPGMTEYLRGMQAIQVGDGPQAVQDWQRGTQEDPSSPQCWVALGDIDLRAQRFAEAERCFDSASRLVPGEESVFLQLARAANGANDFPVAAVAARRAVQLSPQDPDALALAGGIAFLHNQPTQAQAWLRQAHVLRPDDETTLIELVKTDLAVGDAAAARSALTPYSQAHPADLQACYWMAYLDQQAAAVPGNLRAALDFARRAYAAAPQDTAVNVQMGQLALLAGKSAAAAGYFRAVLRTDPSQQDALAGLQASLQRLGQTGQAAPVAAALQRVAARRNQIAELNMQLQANPRDIGVGLQLARLQEQDRHIRLAQMYYEQMVRFAPHDPRTHAALAAFLTRMGRPDLARQAANVNFMP